METAKKKKQRQLLCFSFFIISKKNKFIAAWVFFSNKCSCTTALFFAVPTPKTTILLWLGKWVLNIQKNRKITISSIVYYKYYICFLNVMHCVCLCHYISPWWPLVLKKISQISEHFRCQGGILKARRKKSHHQHGLLKYASAKVAICAMILYTKLLKLLRTTFP